MSLLLPTIKFLLGGCILYSNTLFLAFLCVFIPAKRREILVLPCPSVQRISRYWFIGFGYFVLFLSGEYQCCLKFVSSLYISPANSVNSGIPMRSGKGKQKTGSGCSHALIIGFPYVTRMNGMLLFNI